MAIASVRDWFVSRRTTLTPARARTLFELEQEPPPEADATRGRRHPHALELGRFVAVELQDTAANRFALASRDEEEAVWWPQFVIVGGDALRGIEAGGEAPIELGEVLPHAIPRVGIGRVDDDELDRARRSSRRR